VSRPRPPKKPLQRKQRISNTSTINTVGGASRKRSRLAGTPYQTVFNLSYKKGSAQEFNRAPISCGFLKGDEFYLRGAFLFDFKTGF
jgi:hypothetical protein